MFVRLEVERVTVITGIRPMDKASGQVRLCHVFGQAFPIEDYRPHAFAVPTPNKVLHSSGLMNPLPAQNVAE